MHLASLIALGSSAFLAQSVLAQTPARDPIASALRSVPWRSIGPANNAGRISVVAGVPGDPSTYYVAGANGGIIKTTNGGVTFRPIFDRQDIASIGAIAVAPSDPNVIYVGTGEGNPRNNASIGDGMYKSVDAGENWTKIGLEKTDKIARIVVDTRNPDNVYVCALGREWGPNEDRGVFRTSDGGRTWKKSLYVDPQTACSDISADPNNFNIVYAGMYTYRRWAWYFDSGAGNTAVYKSVNGGDTWERLSGADRNRGLPREDMDRIGIAVAPSDPSIVYVISETKTQGQLWRSDDAGDSWRTVSSDRNISFRPFYYSDIRVDPANPNRIFALSGSLYLSEDGGTTFRTIAQGVHGDHQAMWIDPLNPKRILEGSDGGWQRSFDGGRTWEVENTFAFTQFYHVNYDLQKPYMMCGGLQDNGTWCGPQIGLYGGIRKNDWFTISGGDGFAGVPDLEKPWIVYSDAQGGMIYVTDMRSGTQKQIYPYPNRVGSVGDAMIGHKYRFNWNSPIAVSVKEPGAVYFGGNVLFKSRDYGQSWQVISPDLTTNNPEKQKSSGGSIVTDNTAAEFHCTIISIAVSELDPNVIWVGTDDGNVQVTRDGGRSWNNVFTNVPGLKPNAWIPTVEASHFDVGTAYIAADHHQDDDYAPYAYMTTDFGRTWKPIMGDLPRSAAWVHVVREDRKNRNLLFIGTEMGLWASWDRGAHWYSMRGDLPIVQVRDLQIHPRENDLIVATHGRGMLVLDDIGWLQNLNTAVTADATLFDVRDAVNWNDWNRDGNLGQKAWSAPNPPNGALITYYLRAQQPVALTITEKGSTQVVRRLNAPSTAGMNRVAWDLTYDAPAADGGGGGGGGGRGAGGGRGGRGGGGGGIDVLPGTYTVTLVAGSQRLSRDFKVELDPRIETTTEALVARNNAARQMQQLTSRVTAIVNTVDDLTSQLSALQSALRSAARDTSNRVPPSALPEIDGALADLRQFRDSVLVRPLSGLGYRQYPRLREEVQSVSGMISRAPRPPTQGELLRAGELHTETNEAQARLDAIVAGRIGRINTLLRGLPHVLAPPIRIVQ
jgi:photosystem II stability/assembly factor-like uncharacterized protein